MSCTKYDKLVRDRIPEIIKSKGQYLEYLKIENDGEFQILLKCKLIEEVAEYLKSNDPSELADIVEVVDALAKLTGGSFEEVMRLREVKSRACGAFDNRIFLLEADSFQS